MSKACQVCGGMIFAANEVSGYGGPICSGTHVIGLPQPISVSERTSDLAKTSPKLSSSRTSSDQIQEILKQVVAHYHNVFKDVEIAEELRLAGEKDIVQKVDMVMRDNAKSIQEATQQIQNLLVKSRIETGDAMIQTFLGSRNMDDAFDKLTAKRDTFKELRKDSNG